MITETVMFDLPEGVSRDAVIADMLKVAPRWRAEGELIRKTFLYDPVRGRSGAHYLWKSRAAALRAHDEAWRQRIRDAYGSEPVIEYFESPVVADNALGETLVDAAERLA